MTGTFALSPARRNCVASSAMPRNLRTTWTGLQHGRTSGKPRYRLSASGTPVSTILDSPRRDTGRDQRMGCFRASSLLCAGIPCMAKVGSAAQGMPRRCPFEALLSEQASLMALRPLPLCQRCRRSLVWEEALAILTFVFEHFKQVPL